MKCRGREYLRIIYGPEYTRPRTSSGCAARGLGRKRSLALREFALGVEGLERFVRARAAAPRPRVRLRRAGAGERAGRSAALIGRDPLGLRGRRCVRRPTAAHVSPRAPKGRAGPCIHASEEGVTCLSQLCAKTATGAGIARGCRRAVPGSPRFGLGSSIPAMARFSVDFLGCKVSHVDVHEIRERLLADGHAEAAPGAAADVAVINTCCVTNEAVAKSRKAAARAARTHGRVYVTGCAANLAGNAFASLPANVTVVARRAEETAAFVAGDVGAIGCVQADARLDRVRAFVKIQDGCSFSCSFCVIPLVRGASRSRRADAVLGEVRRRVEQGHREIVLTGINLGCFRDRDAGFDLPRLVREVGATPGLDRLRLSSIEINHVNDELVAALRETPTVAQAPPRPAPVGRRRRAARDAPPLLDRHVPATPRAARRASST